MPFFEPEFSRPLHSIWGIDEENKNLFIYIPMDLKEKKMSKPMSSE
tara:strand:+ start:718 stop:855 length:138 start_codon:yes stop_codon:yes gene_type:complete